MSEKRISNYYCTWNYQVLSSGNSTTAGRDRLDHEWLFGKHGLCKEIYPNQRDSLIFLLDDGWELPYSNGNQQNHENFFGSQRVFDDKFPNYGRTPAERLKTLADNIKACGWAGAGIWICAGEEESVSKALEEGAWSEEYWIERLNWSKYAGIAYWKIDWGRLLFNKDWRRMISRKAKEICPGMIIEHSDPEHPVNDFLGGGRLTDRKLRINADCLSYSDVYRTYDATEPLSVATTFDRIGELLCAALPQENDSLGLINGEDELYMCAALGLAMGIMRYPDDNKSTDEMSRAVKFSNIAPAFPAYNSVDRITAEFLEDSWFFKEGDTWKDEIIGHTVVQYAPLGISRNTELPEVGSDTEKPFVSACKNPNGVFSVGTYARTKQDSYRKIYLADVTVYAEGADTFGIFGEYKSLTLTLNKLPEKIKVFASDILCDELSDITDMIEISEKHIIIPGELIHKIGLSNATQGDTGEPGMLLKICNGV